MKTKNFLSQSGGKPDVTRRQNRNGLGSVISRLSLGSIVSRLSVASLICLCMLTVGSGNVWGLTETITLSDFGWSNASTQSSITATSATIALAKNSGSTAPTYYTSDGLRIYGVAKKTTGGTISFTPKTGITISSIAFTHTAQNSGVLSIKNGGGSYSSKTWSGTLAAGSTLTLVATNSGTKAPQVRITVITITYTASAASHTLSSSVSPAASGSVSLSATSVAEGSTATATATPATHYVFDCWSISGTGSTLSSTTTNPTTVTMGTANTTVTANFVAAPKASITLSEAGATTTDASTYYVGDSYTLPSSTGASCGTKVLVGWSTVEVAETNTKPTSNFYEKGASVTLAATQTFYAVFATASGGAATWDKVTTLAGITAGTYVIINDSKYLPNTATSSAPTQGTAPTITGTQITGTVTDAMKWYFTSTGTANQFYIQNEDDDYLYETSANNGLRVGSTSDKWTFAANTLPAFSLQGENNSRYCATYESGSDWRSYTTANAGNYGDGGKVYLYKLTGGTTYSAYSTTCVASHTVSSVVDPAGKATVTLGATSVAEGSTTTATYSNITAGYEFVNWTISGSGATLSSNTATTTTITMGTANVTVTANLQCVTPTFTASPASKTDYLTTDNNPAPLGYTASAAGASLTQQWQVSTDNSNWSNIGGATSATYTPDVSTAGTKYYRVVVTNSAAGCSSATATSNVATITSTAPSGYCIKIWNSSNNGIQSGFNNGGSGSHYTLSFTVPGKDGSSNWPMYWVGENNASQSYSINATLADMPLYANSSTAKLGLAEGATGTLHIWDDNKASGSNLWVKFQPSGYGLRWGGAGDWNQAANTKPFTVDANDANVYWTDIVTLDGTNNTSWNYYVGLQTASGYVYSGVDDENSDQRGISRTRSVTAMKVSNGTAGQWKATYLNSEPTGSKGKFRIWDNNTDDYGHNLCCHWVPFYEASYNVNGGGAISPAAVNVGPVCCEGTPSERQVTMPAAPTYAHHDFGGWKSSADNSINNAGATVSLTQNTTFTAQWTNTSYNITATLTNVTSSTSFPVAYTYTGSAANVTYTFSGASGYRLPTTVTVSGCAYTWDSSTGELTLTGTITSNVTITIAGVRAHTITWSANGVTTTSVVDDGNTLVLPAVDPTSCDDGDTDTYTTFIGWYTTAAGTNSAPTASIASCGTKAESTHVPTGNETYYAVWGDGELVGGWSKVTSFAAGDVVIFVNETASKEMSDIALISSNTCGIASDYTTNPAGTYPLTIEAGNGGSGYSFKTGDNKYLSWSSGNTLIKSDTKNDASSWTISSSTDGNYKFANVATTERIMQYNTGSPRWACYGNDNQTTFQLYKQAIGATGFISSCCGSAAVVSVTPVSSALALDIDGNASTSISISQTGGGSGRYHEPTITPAVGASTNWAGSYKTAPYNLTFTATAAGTYTVKADFTETAAGCAKTGTATITVAANPILTPSSASVDIAASCGAASAATDITVNSRYLAGSSITASIVKSSGSGSLTISSDGTNFSTSNKTISGGTSSKVTSHIYVRYEAVADEVGSASGTLTLTQGETSVDIPISVTVTCGCNIRFTSSDPVQITAANGIWVQANSELALSGSYLKTNADNANVSIRAYTNNAHFQLKTSGTDGEGAAKTSSANALSLATNVSSNTANGWTGNIGIVYKPAEHNTTETATLTVEVYRYGGSTVYSSTTYTLYGRSLPENFVIAVTDGSGNWFAVPADMVAPWGGSCSSGLSTYTPYPIEVNNTTTPTAISGNTPSRAVYTAAARTGNANTNPQTLSFKSVPLAGSGNYYLYGSVSAEGSATNIQNASNAASEKQKWFLDVIDWSTKKYNMHLASSLNTNLLSYYTGTVGQYSAAGKKADIYILPATSTCANYIAPKNITCQGIDATNYTIQFKPDRTTNYEISLNGSSWSDVTTSIVSECNENDEQPTLVEAQIPLATYRGQTVYIRVKAAGSCAESTTFAVPNPSLTVNAGTWLTMTGVAGQAFSNSDNSITISGLASCSNTVSVAVSGTNADKITASINSSTGVVTIGMSAVNAVAGTYNATLTFTAGGATTQTQNIKITIQNYAIQAIVGNPTYFSNGVLCYSADLEGDYYPLAIQNALYKDGSYITLGDFNSNSAFTFTDLNTGSTSIGSGLSVALNDAHSVKVCLKNKIAAMVAGHTYRLAWTNTNKVVTNSAGLPYQDCYIDFVYSLDCTAPVAMTACPIGVNTFTANWDGLCDATNSSLNVYTKGAPTTILNNFANTTSNTFNLQYVGASNLSGNYWVTNVHGTSAGVVTVSNNYGLLISDVSNNKYYNLFSPLLSQLIGTVNTSDEYEITINLATNTAQSGIGVDFYVMSNGSSLAKNTTPSITDKTVTIDGVSGTSKRLAMNGSSTSVTHTFTVSGLAGTDRIRFLGWETAGVATASKNVYIFTISMRKLGSNVSVTGYPKNVTCSTKKYDVTGLSAGTTYYYTLTNSGHTSNEMTLTTRTAHTPQMGFNPGYAVLQSDGGGAVSEEVALTDGNVGSMAKYFYSLCSANDISYTITGTNAAMFSADWSGVNYYSDLGGYLDGNLVITYNPGGVEGVHTATLTVTESGQTFELPLKGITCPASFSTMATAATNVGNTTATANWSQSTTGNLMLSMDGVLNAEMILNGGLETGDKTGWTDSGVAGVLGGTITSTSATKHSGSYGVYTPVSNSTAMNISGSNYGAIFASPITLTPGTYRMTAWVRGASDASTVGYLTESSVAIGLATINESTHYATKQYASAGLGASNNTWQELTADFEVTVAGTYYPFVGHGNSKGAMFIDDVSLKRTAAEPNEEGYDAYPITSATSLNLTGLQPSTAYSYYVVNANGCESNVITFNTTGEVGEPELDADDVTISGSAGTTATAVAVVEATNVVSDITLSLGSCTTGLSLGATKLSSTGGTVSVIYAIPADATPGSSGTCTVSMITTGLASPVTFTINWSVESGSDINTPVVEVTDITNESITVESNQTNADGAHIIISREMTAEEIAANLNVGDEIFFSKYYEAYSNTKLWAIFNPTDHKISLANTYVWRSSSSNTWQTDMAFSLAGAGAIETGYIHPSEEIIVYTSDQVGTCERSKADMSEWYSGTASDRALSYSGDDALLLVRKDVSGTSDDPPSESVDGETNYSWRKYNDGNNDWWMLDLIGARTAANLPTDGACTTWSWTNCKTSTVEKGDAKGWVGTDGKYLDNTTYSLCSPYVLSTNRCLLIRERSVKCGNNAVATNVGDMYTLGKSGVPTEWNGAHVPLNGDQANVSCNNFTFVGGYDYAGYYNSWVEMEDVDIAEATPNDDGSFTFEDMEIPKYYCHPYHIEVTQTVTLNGVEVENILAYTDYKVPIVVDEVANTTTAKFFSTPHADNTLTSAICNECDVVIRDNAKLSHISGGQARFRNMTVYPGAKFSNEVKQAFRLNRLYMQSLNNTVGYAIINNDGSSIIADTIIHIKRINDADWYSFTLPYNCDVTTIRQLNGKVVGKYWDGSSAYVDEDWTIQYYDGKARQAAGTSAAAGENSEFWKYVPANGTLEAGKAYVVGLFTTEWSGQHKTLYFPPTTYPGYSESGTDAKTTSVSNWAAGLSSEKRHHGWNFVGSPYISRFGETTAGQGLNNTASLIMGKLNESGTYEDETEVYVTIPIPGAKAYDQVRAAATTLDPFKGYFVQAIDPDNGEDGTLTLTYAKDYRTLSAAPARRGSVQKQRVVVDLVVEGNNSSDIGGIVVDDKYTTEYEIGGDLTKMYAAAKKPQLYFPDKDNQKLAYIALPDANAENVPMELYAPKAGNYVIRLNVRSSRTEGAEIIELLYNGNVVANLLIEDYTIEAAKGTNTGYSVRIRRAAQVTTSTETINGEHVTVVCNNGQISICNVPADAEVLVFDMVGKLMRQGKADGEHVVNIDAPQQGVYNIVIQSATGNAAIKTVVR